MKLTATASTLALVAASAASADGTAPPVQMDPAPIVQQTKASSSSAAIIIPLILIALLVVAANTSTSGATTEAVSDARLKTDIRRTGTAPNGLPLYRFRYIGMSTEYEGVMAQDVLKLRPDAVVERFGFYAVDYGKLGLEMKTVH